MLNRHVNQPSNLIRLAANVVDFLIFALLAFLSVQFIFKPIFVTNNAQYQEQETVIYSAYVRSGLFIKGENDVYSQYVGNDTETYKKIVEDYYLTDIYFGSTWYKEKGGTRNAYKVQEYNAGILQIGGDDSLFEYDYTAGEVDKTKLGVLKASLYVDEDKTKDLKEDSKPLILNFYKGAYRDCFQDLFKDNYFNETYKFCQKYDGYALVLGLTVSSAIVYLIVPLFTIYGYTVGRLIFKIQVVSLAGFVCKKYQIALRYVLCLILCLLPLFISDLFVLAPIWGAYLFISLIAAIILQERTSLPDLISFTRLADGKASTIYMSTEDMEENEED